MGISLEILFRDFLCFGVMSLATECLADNSLQILMDKFLPGNVGEDYYHCRNLDAELKLNNA